MICAAPDYRRAVMDIVVWLRSLGLGKYEAIFRENDIDKTVLLTLTAEDLKELGVTSFGHRRKLVDAIAALSNDPSSKKPSVDAATASDTSSTRPRRTSPSDGDVLRLGRFNGAVCSHGPGGFA